MFNENEIIVEKSPIPKLSDIYTAIRMLQAAAPWAWLFML